MLKDGNKVTNLWESADNHKPHNSASRTKTWILADTKRDLLIHG